MFDESKRQRAMRPEVGVSRQALGVVSPVNQRLGEWQSSAALLVALSRRRYLPEARQKVREEVRQLSAAVQAEQRALAERAKVLPPSVASSGRILDTRRALDSLGQTLETVLTQDLAVP